MAKNKSVRKRIYEIIEHAEENDRVSFIYDIVMLVAIIVSIIPRNQSGVQGLPSDKDDADSANLQVYPLFREHPGARACLQEREECPAYRAVDSCFLRIPDGSHHVQRGTAHQSGHGRDNFQDLL